MPDMNQKFPQRSLAWLWIIVALAVLVGGVWYGVAVVSNANQENLNTNQTISNQNVRDINGSLGIITRYSDPSDRFEVPLYGEWSGEMDGNTVMFSTNNQILALTVEQKSISQTLRQYAELKTSKAAVGEGTYEPFMMETIGGFSCVQVNGTYARPFTYDYCGLSDTDVLVIGGAVPNDQALANARKVILGIKKPQ